MNDELDLSISPEIRVENALLVFGDERLALIGIVLRVQDELGADHIARQRKDIERSMNEVIPLPGDVQTANFTIAARLVFNW